MSEQKPFKVEKEGHIAWLTLNRPEKRNAMSRAFFNDLIVHFDDFDKDPEVRVVVIKAEGKSFTVGLDLVEFAGDFNQDGSAGSREQTRQNLFRLQESMNIIDRCRKPVIAAVHSHCIGGGVDMLCTCDIRMASKDTVFSVREVKMGVIADLGTLQRLSYIVGEGWFKDLSLTGRDFTAEEALQMGFVTRVHDTREDLYKEAKKLAEEISSSPPLTVQGIKDVINFCRDESVDAGLKYIAQKNVAMVPAEDTTEAIMAFIEKRKPVFKGN